MKPQKMSALKSGGYVDLAFAVVVLTSYFTTFSSLHNPSPSLILLLTCAGMIYFAVGIYGFAFCSNVANRWIKLGYFGMQIPLGGLIVYLGRGAGLNALILLPLAAHAVMLLPQTWTMLVNLTIVLVYIFSYTLYAGWMDIFTGLPTFIAYQAFIVVFTQMAVGEGRSRNEVERLVDELESANQRLREYALQVEELAITKERNRLAREIHDGLGHYLTTIHMQLQAARAVMKSSPQRAQEMLVTVQNLTQQALSDVRTSVAAMRSTPAETLPLPETIPMLLKNTEVSGITQQFDILGTPRPLSPEAQLTLYRTAQEGLSNVSEHARATLVKVTLDYSAADKVRLDVHDNGAGANTLDGGYGLMGLQERASLLRGEFHVTTTDGEGVTIQMVVPG